MLRCCDVENNLLYKNMNGNSNNDSRTVSGAMRRDQGVKLPETLKRCFGS